MIYQFVVGCVGFLGVKEMEITYFISGVESRSSNKQFLHDPWVAP